MPARVQILEEKGLIRPPHWLSRNICYETIMGSVAYGVSSDTSDMDIYGFCIPPRDILFPHLAGSIIGFGKEQERFNQFQEHHIEDKDAMGGKGRMYDVAIFSIVRLFHLCMENNPNMIDSIFTPVNCVLHSTKVGEMVREKRRMFLHKGSYQKFLGYAHSQLHKMTTKNPKGKRKELRDEFGFDIKYAYHLVRLSDECSQILTTGDLDLQRAKEHMKAIRRGDVSEADLRSWFSERERTLEREYAESKLPHGPDENAIKRFLLECLEEHYGSLASCVVLPDAASQTLGQIMKLLEQYYAIQEKPAIEKEEEE